MIKLLRLMSAFCAFVAGLSALAHLADLLPQSYAITAAALFAFVFGLKDAVIACGDILDDGLKNGSFPPASDFIKKGAPLILAACLLPACVSSSSTDRELAMAQVELGAAQMAVSLAQSQVSAALKSNTPPMQRLALMMTLSQARAALDREQARVAFLVTQSQALASQPLQSQPLPH
jgi:hypothetical protein